MAQGECEFCQLARVVLERTRDLLEQIETEEILSQSIIGGDDMAVQKQNILAAKRAEVEGISKRVKEKEKYVAKLKEQLVAMPGPVGQQTEGVSAGSWGVRVPSGGGFTVEVWGNMPDGRRPTDLYVAQRQQLDEQYNLECADLAETYRELHSAEMGLRKLEARVKDVADLVRAAREEGYAD